MDKRQSYTLNALRNAKVFLDEHAPALPAIAALGVRQDFDSSLDAVNTLVEAQAVHALSAKGSTQLVASLRSTLMGQHIKPIARVARLKLPDTPEIAPLRNPRGRLSALQLVAYAKSMATEATKHADVFVAAGSATDFAPQLVTAADALSRAVSTRDATAKKRTGTTRTLDSQLALARRTLRAVDGYVSTALEHDPTLLNIWQATLQARRPNKVASKVPTTTPVVAQAGGSTVGGSVAAPASGSASVPVSVPVEEHVTGVVVAMAGGQAVGGQQTGSAAASSEGKAAVQPSAGVA